MVPADIQASLQRDRQALLALSDATPAELREFMADVISRLHEQGYCVVCCKWTF
jgi:hypothetical protein